MLEKKPHICNLIRNIPFIISGMALATLNISPVSMFSGIFVAAIVLIIFSLFFRGTGAYWKSHLSFPVVLISAVLIVLCACSFCATVINSSMISSMADWVGVSPQGLVLAAAVIGGVVAFYFCSTVVSVLISKGSSVKEKKVGISEKCVQRAIIGMRVFIIFLFGVLVACSFNSSIWLDESFSLRMIQWPYTDIIRFTAADVHPPLYYFMLKAVEDLFSFFSTEFAFRVVVAKLFSVLAYALTGLLCWHKLKKYNIRGGRELLMLCLFASSSIIGYAIEIRMYAWATFFVTAVFLYAKDIMDGDAGIGTWVILVFFSECCAYTHYFALASMAAVWIFLLIWLLIKNRHELLKWIIAGGIAIIGYLPWITVWFAQTQAISGGYWIPDITLGYVARYFTFLFPDLLILILAVVIYYFWKQRKVGALEIYRNSVGILIPMATILIGVVISLLFVPVFNRRYLSPSFLCLWISVFFIWRFMERQKKILVAGILLCGCLASCFGLLYQETLFAGQSRENRELFASTDENKVVFVADDVSDHVFFTIADYTDETVYYSGDVKEKDIFQTMYAENIRLVDDTGAALTVMLQEGKDIYYVTSDNNIENASLNEEVCITPLGEYYFESEYLFEYKSFVYEIKRKS